MYLKSFEVFHVSTLDKAFHLEDNLFLIITSTVTFGTVGQYQHYLSIKNYTSSS
jgi:hypothetical protein